MNKSNLYSKSQVSDKEVDEVDYNYKVILVGSSGVGKTSLTTRFVEDRFDDKGQSNKMVQIMHKLVNLPT